MLILTGNPGPTRQHSTAWPRRSEWSAVNSMVRAAALGRDPEVYAGDRVLFTRNSDRYAVRNGNRGTVLAVEPLGRSLAVRLDDGRRLTVTLADYPHLLLGYAVTIAQSRQGPR